MAQPPLWVKGTTPSTLGNSRSKSGPQNRAVTYRDTDAEQLTEEMTPLRHSPADSGRLATATLSLSRRRRTKSSKRSDIWVFYLIKPSPVRHNDELMSRELPQDQWIQSAVLEFEAPLILYAARIL